MDEKKRLNVKVPEAISNFESAARKFELKEKIYKVILRGKGLEFETYRDYTPDDDAVFIDWKASKRSNKLLVKQYIEERDLDIIFVVDVSENMVLGSGDKLKCEYATELIAALSHLMITSNDRVGFVLYNDKIEFIPPKGGLPHFHRFVDKLSDPKTYGGVSKIENALKFILESLDKNVKMVIFVSDFSNVNESISESLFLVSHRFESMAIMVKDLLDKELPDVNNEIVIEDPISKEQLIINPKKIGELYRKKVQEKENMINDIFEKSNIDIIELITRNSFVFPLAVFLKERVKKKGFFSPLMRQE